MAEPRVIKRYSNRKLYDTERSRYVTLDQIADMIRSGEDVRIVDNNSKEDLTSITLAQIIFEEEKKQKSFLPLQSMRNIIQSGGERIEELVSQAQKKVSGVFHRTKGAPGEGQPAGEGAEPPVAAVGSTEAVNGNAAHQPREGAFALREFRDWLEASQRTLDEWQKKVDERVRTVVEGISPFASIQKEVGALASRINDLERKLEQVARDEESNS